MNKEDIGRRVQQTLATVLELNPSQIGDDASPETIPQWDSLRNMNLIVAVEEEFGIQFTDDEIMSGLSFSSIVRAVAERGA